jgi:hypothetical protein
MSLSKEFEKYSKNLKIFSSQIRMLKHRLALQGEKNIRNAFFRRGFQSRTGETVKIRHKLIHDGVLFISDTEYSQYLENGVKRHVMKYLLKAKRPIPIDIGNKVIYRKANRPKGQRYIRRKGTPIKPMPIKVEKKIIFRRCTRKSIAQGHWVHKGIKKDRHVNNKLGFMEDGIKKTLTDANREIENLKKQIRSA